MLGYLFVCLFICCSSLSVYPLFSEVHWRELRCGRANQCTIFVSASVIYDSLMIVLAECFCGFFFNGNAKPDPKHICTFLQNLISPPHSLSIFYISFFYLFILDWFWKRNRSRQEEHFEEDFPNMRSGYAHCNQKGVLVGCLLSNLLSKQIKHFRFIFIFLYVFCSRF